MKSALIWLIQHIIFLFASSIDSRASSGASLVVAPHPDDETLGCGAVIARAKASGQKVRVVIMTDGAAAGKSAKITPEQLAHIRHEETLQAGKALGLAPEDIVFLRFPDTQTHLHVEAMAAALRQQIADFQPQQIFSPFGIDLNPDHVSVATAMDRLVKNNEVSCPVYEYPVWLPLKSLLLTPFSAEHKGRIRFNDSSAFLGAKRAALDAHRTQIENITGEDTWFTLSPQFLARFFYGFELFFEKRMDGK